MGIWLTFQRHSYSAQPSENLPCRSSDGLGPDGQVVRYDGPTGAFMYVFVPNSSGGLARPFGLVFGPDGEKDGKLDLYVLSAPDTALPGPPWLFAAGPAASSPAPAVGTPRCTSPPR